MTTNDRNQQKEEINSGEKKLSGFSPLSHPIYKTLWFATIGSNIGNAMHEVGALWLMTNLSQSPLMVALLQTSTALAMVLLSLFAGGLADVVDRRKLLLITQAYMFIVAITLGFLTIGELITPTTLLLLTFMLGAGAAISIPSSIAITLEMVSKPEIPATITLGGVSLNIGRALGPAIFGFIIASLANPGFVFILNALSFIGLIFVLSRWHPSQEKRNMPAEHIVGAMKAGVRYLIRAPAVQSIIIRAISFTIFGAALFALLPSLMRYELGFDSLEFGFMLGSLGTGAIIGGTLILPYLREKISTEWHFSGATILFAAVMILLTSSSDFIFLLGVMFAGGIAWIIVMASLNVSMYKANPKWVGARSLATHTTIFQGGLAAGSVIWGSVAANLDVRTALIIAAVGLGLGLLTGLKFKLISDVESKSIKTSASMYWSSPTLLFEPSLEEGPVLVKIEYKIDKEHQQQQNNKNILNDFLIALKDLSKIRKRDGAIQWGVYRDGTEPNIFVETFVVESWAEHLRQHERLTAADIEILDKVRSFHIGDKPPVVTHYVAEPLPTTSKYSIVTGSRDKKKEIENEKIDEK
ncbi:MAG TPA: MFS transporter [Nitrososphaeraceae archaeon]|nr:MFS transporter [Nitrososphaeraceae archaeon]